MHLEAFGKEYYVPNWAITCAIGASGVYITYKYLTRPYKYFKKRGIDGPPPSFPFGTLMPYFKEGIWKLEPLYYKKYGPKVYGGFFNTKPTLNVCDLDMIRDIFVKEFPSFENRLTAFKSGDPVIDNNVANLEGEQWKSVRNILSPAFSSGKLKLMIDQINECAALLTENVMKHAIDGSEFDAKVAAECCTLDMIGRIAYGLKVNTQKDDGAEFVKMARKVFTFSKFNIKFWIAMLFPFMARVFNYFGIPVFPRDVRSFFKSVLENAITQRQDAGIVQQDLLQIMLDSLNPNATSDRWSKGELSKEDLMAQGLVFFFAGYETTANATAFAVYHLAVNVECQRKLQDELDSVMGDSTTVTYDMIKQMTYLDMVINETLRINPAAPSINRMCNADTTIGGVLFEKGLIVNIPAYAIHMDENIYPNPTQFDPERFTKEAKEKRHPFAWLPFGSGPRSCIGMRLALVEVKIALAHLFKTFNVVTSENTEIPPKLEIFQMKATNGLKLKLEKR